LKRHKYRAVPTTVDGIRFPSKAEARRYGELKILESAGKITNFQLQPEFPIKINGKLVCTYRADFIYFTPQQRVIEDVKGVRTAVYKLKKKMVEAYYPGVKIVEIR